MSQVSVNVVAPLGYTGPTLAGDNNYVQIVDASGDPVFNTKGQSVIIGENAYATPTTINKSVVIGSGAMQNSTAATNFSVAIGFDAMKASGNSGGSVAIGYQALYNTNGIAAANVAVGKDSLFLATTGSLNTAIGNQSGNAVTTGSSNILVGNNSGSALTTGTNNIFIGVSSASFNSGDLFTGSNNIAIGGLSNPSSLTVNNEITLGNSSNSVLRCAVTSITSLSDARDKKEIEELPVGLEFVKGLKPVKFVWDDRNEEGKHDVADFGFIAQDLKASQEEVEMADTLKLVYEENPEKLEASYGKLIPILVKAIQDLSEEVKQLKNK
jgi:hypothetical protein